MGKDLQKVFLALMLMFFWLQYVLHFCNLSLSQLCWDCSFLKESKL